jgi:hypothetical protein
MVITGCGADKNTTDDTGGGKSGCLIFSLLRLDAICLVSGADAAIVALRTGAETL